MAGLVAWWVQRYTRDLPAAAGQRRCDEVSADLHDHTAFERGRGVSDRRIALSILSRMIRGVAADASWRRRTRRESLMKPLLVVAAILVVALGVAAVVLGEADDSPGLQGLGVLLVIAAVTLSVRRVRRDG